jgi:hypothetical protein
VADRPTFRESELEARRQVVALATEMLAGRLNYFEGASRIWALQSQVGGLGDRDPDFDAFALINSETDHLPLEKQKSLWSLSAIERLTPEFKRTEEWAAEFAPDACRNIISRFSNHDS